MYICTDFTVNHVLLLIQHIYISVSHIPGLQTKLITNQQNGICYTNVNWSQLTNRHVLVLIILYSLTEMPLPDLLSRKCNITSVLRVIIITAMTSVAVCVYNTDSEYALCTQGIFVQYTCEFPPDYSRHDHSHSRHIFYYTFSLTAVVLW